MEKAKRLFFLTIPLVILLSSCVSPRGVSERDIVLTESEIPWRMTPGQYTTPDGEAYFVRENQPRWSVSEAWMFNSFSGIDKNKDGFFDKICINFLILIVLLGILILILILRYSHRRFTNV